MIHNILVFLALLFLSGYFLARSGVQPSDVNINLEAGLTFAVGALFLLVDRLLSANPNKEVLAELRDLRDEVATLREQLDDYR